MKSLYNSWIILLLALVSSAAWADDVTLDATKGYSINAGTNLNVTLSNRTFTAGQWTGFCLPFDASEAVLKATFPDGYNLQEYSSYAATTNTVSFKKVTEAKAGTPYFIKTTATVTDPVFSGVSITSAAYSISFQEVTLATDLIFRGFYFNTYYYQLYDSNNINTFYLIQSDGTMKSLQDGLWNNDGEPGVNAYIIRKNYQSYTAGTPTLSFEGNDTGGGESGGDQGGGESGDTSSLSYKIKNKQQLTDVPTLYITLTTQSDNITDDALNTVLYKDRSTGEAPYLDATIQVIDDQSDKSDHHLESFTDQVQIKVRGNSTANPTNGKKAYRLKFPKKHKHDLLGLGYTKRNWTLLANVFDHSMIRNALTYHLNKEVGMDFCPGYKFVDVVINGNYRGTYQISDHVEADANRVNVNEDTGWMVEFQGRSDMLDKPVCFSSNGLQLNIKNPEPADETDDDSVAEVVTPIQNWFINTWQPKWTSTSAFSSTNGWRSVNDEESLLKFWIVTELTGDYDGWMTVKAYKEADGEKLFYGPVWDKDLAYGNCSYENSDILIYNSSNGSSLTSYLQTIAKDPAFAKKLSSTLNALLDGGLISRLKAKVDDLAAIVAQTEELCNTKYPRSTNVGGLEVAGKETYAEYVQLLKDYLDKRAATVKQQVADLLATATTKQTITINPSVSSWETGYQTLYDHAGAYADITISPATTITSDSWSTLFLPFDADESQLKAALGGDFVLATLTSATDGAFHFTQTDAKTVAAGTPYLIKMKSGSSTGTSWTFQDVTLMDANDNAQTLNDGTLSASYHKQVINDNSKTYYLSNGQLVKFDTQWSGATNPVYSIDGLHFYFVSTTAPSITITETTEDLPTEHQQLTSLPTIYITGTPGDSWSRCGVEIFDKDNKMGGTATYLSTDTKKGVQFQYQGSGSGNKDSFRFKFDKKTQLLSSGKFKQWVLSSNDDDPTMLNNALAFDMSEALGLAFTPKYQFVDLFLNDVYMGTYQLCDRVKAEAGRALTTGGDKDQDWLVQLASKGEVKEEGDDFYAQTTTTPNIIVKNPDPDDYSGDAKTALINTVGSWFADTFFSDINAISSNINQEQVIAYYLAQELLCTYKGLSSVNVWRSVTATDQTVYFGPIWDSEKSFGNTPKHPIDMTDLTTAGSFDGLITEYADYKIMRRFFKNLWVQPWFASGVVEKWKSVSASLKTLLLNNITTLAAEIEASRKLNYSKASSTGTGWELKDATSYEAAIQQLQTYITERFAYLDAKLPEMQQTYSGTIVYNTKKDDALEAWPYYNNVETSVRLKNRGTLHGGVWNMLCLPFSLSATQLATAFGSDVAVKQFDHVSETQTTVDYYFTPVTQMEHAVPYLVKPAADVSFDNLKFADVTFSTDAAQTVNHDGYQLHGTLQKTALTAAATTKYLGTNNQLKTLTQDTSIYGCRAWIETTTDGAAKQCSILGGDDTTGIETLVTSDDASATTGRAYNLSGQPVGTSATALPHGVYIVGGRKVVR